MIVYRLIHSSTFDYLHLVEVFEYRVRHHNVGKHVTVLNKVDLVQCEMVVQNENFVNFLSWLSAALILAVHCHNPIRLSSFEKKLKLAVRI